MELKHLSLCKELSADRRLDSPDIHLTGGHLNIITFFVLHTCSPCPNSNAILYEDVLTEFPSWFSG